MARPLKAHGIPGLTHWTWVPTPGHAPGHVALFRPSDRVLLAEGGIDRRREYRRGWLAWARGSRPSHACPPPRYTNWNQALTEASLSVLAALEPRVLATGHGAPPVGDAAVEELQGLAGAGARLPSE